MVVYGSRINERSACAGMTIAFSILALLLAGCNLTDPAEFEYDFLEQFGAAEIATGSAASFDFLINFDRGKIFPTTTSAITPNGKPVYTAATIEVAGVTRKGFVIFAPAQITFENIRIQESPRLSFGVNKLFAVGDGALGVIIIQEGIRRDTVFRRYLNPRDSLSHRRWFDEDISLQPYVGKLVSITFAADVGPQRNDVGDFFAWSEPRLEFTGTEDTPNKRGAFVARNWKIGGEERDAVITLAGSSLSYILPGSRTGEILSFGTGMQFLVGDGAEGLLLVEVGSRRDTLFRRYLNPAGRPQDRKWFDAVVDLSTYRGREIKIIFEAHPGPANNFIADWFAWSRPKLSLPYR